MTHEAGAPEYAPHEPAPSSPRELFPPLDQVLRGIALSVLGLTLLALGAESIKRMGLWAAPAGAAALVAAVGSLWASVVHLTGGERFDDHPFL